MSYNVGGYNSMHSIGRVFITLAIHAGKFTAMAMQLDGSYVSPQRLMRWALMIWLQNVPFQYTP
jgi:hypothetical protein